ncbi:McrB family protein [Shewanella sp. HL-SH4]|uniref:McrB family protein n=1 Tax=Shewanella sp. HL-SH4 TaxID=3436240 RepID=UPI003EB90170
MSDENIVYSLDVAKNLTKDQLYQKMYESWGITNEKIEVWGELSINDLGNWAGVRYAKKLSDNQEIEYPLEGSQDLQFGVFLSPAVAKLLLNDEKTCLVSCELVLAYRTQREKKDNPFLLAVKEDSIQRLTHLPNSISNSERLSIIQDKDRLLISKIIYDSEIQNVKSRVAADTSALLESVENKKLEISKEKEALEATHHKEAEALKTNIELQKMELNKSIQTLQKNQDKNQLLSSDNAELKRSIDVHKNNIDDLKLQQKKIEEIMARKIEKLTNFIEEKAVFLKTFEFIDEEDFDDFIHKVDKSRDTSELLSFKDVLKGDYKLAVSYIQAYLKEQDILYPRHIIENYLTLLRTNDLIILAGDSGSGKTNLVNSFAEAVGGVSKIIPVKPNWTSSEDLLGYYNPLEKKYLATPFLEALIEAQKNPDVPYFICLDEMNLARVEYYFADFLSKLEERKEQPTIELYSDDEASHVLSELKGVNAVITSAQEKYSQGGITDFVSLMTDENVNAEIKRAFGFSEKESLIKYHGEIRRMLAGIINTPSSITIPENVRIIGAVNIDETTHYLSPKILDRAHIMKFKSPLLSDWDSILKEVDAYGFTDVSKPVLFAIDELGVRAPYPKYDGNNEFCALFKAYNSDYFHPLGVEFGMRTIRQGLNYLALFKDVNDNSTQAINNFIIHKVLPKFTFDGDKKSGGMNKLQRVAQVFYPELEKLLDGIEGEFSAHIALSEIIDNAESNDSIVNYWA